MFGIFGGKKNKETVARPEMKVQQGIFRTTVDNGATEIGYEMKLFEKAKFLRTSREEIHNLMQQPGTTKESLLNLARDIMKRADLHNEIQFKIADVDNDAIKTEKNKIAQLVKLIKQDCGIGDDELFMNAQEKSRAMNLRVQGVRDFIGTAKEQWLENILVVMKKRYENASDERMKELLYEDLPTARDGYLREIDDELSKIDPDDSREMAAAKAELMELRKEVAGILDDLDNLEQAEIAYDKVA